MATYTATSGAVWATSTHTGSRASLPALEDGHVTITRPDNSTLWSGDAPGRRGARWGSADAGSPRIADAGGSTLLWRAP